MALKKAIGYPPCKERACDGNDGHEFEGSSCSRGNIGFHIEAHLILEVEDGDLV